MGQFRGQRSERKRNIDCWLWLFSNLRCRRAPNEFHNINEYLR